jgi:hypothetical protein
MGIYQGCLAIGIAVSGFFIGWILNKKTGSDSSKKEPFYSENRSENYRKI